MKLALIGQGIASLLPSMMTDLLQVRKMPADICIEEKNDAMGTLLEGYAEACFRKAGLGGHALASRSRAEVLEGADLVIYAGDLMASSRFQQDREALMGGEGDEPGLSDQARVNGGLGGLMHTLRQGAALLPLGEAMRSRCPHAVVVTLGDPVARTAEMFRLLGMRSYGLARSVLRGPTGVDGLAQKLGVRFEDVHAVAAGLPGFSFLSDLYEVRSGKSLMNEVYALASQGTLGRLIQRWYREYGAVAVGRVSDIAEYMPAQDDYMPDERPDFGESVEHRKERIRHMNQVCEKGLADPDGMIAQLMLLSRTPPQRPVSLGLALVCGLDLEMDEVTLWNDGSLRPLPALSMVSAPLCLKGGKPSAPSLTLPPAILDLMGDIALTNQLAAKAGLGDMSSLRECVETDPALAGLDRLYLQDVVRAMIRMHSDILTQFEDAEED